MLLHKSGEWIKGSLTIPVSKVDAHGYGSATTYARRFALASFVGVCPEDDDGNAASGRGAKDDAPPHGPSPIVTAMQAAISVCQDEIELNQWKADNKANVEGLGEADRRAVMTAWQKAVKACRDKPVEKPKENFDLGDDDIPPF